MHRLKQAFIVIQRRGLGYLLYLFTGVALPRLGYYLLWQMRRSVLRRLLLTGVSVFALLFGLSIGFLAGWGIAFSVLAVLTLLVVFGLWLNKTLKFQHKLEFARQSIIARRQDDSFTKWENYPVESIVRREIQIAQQAAGQLEIVIGQIDNDGRVYGQYGPLPFVHNISREEFVPRYRFPLDIVLLDGLVLIRKDFRGDRKRFVREWHNLSRLQGHANVPAVFKADEANCVLYKSLIPGRTVRDLLVDAGANILTVNVDRDETLKALSEDERIRAVWERGKSLLSSTFPESFFEKLEEQLDYIHSHGVARLSLTFGNIIVADADGLPWLIDMEGSEHFERTNNLLFDFERDRDREKYNQIYGRSVITEKSARGILREHFSNTYAPIDFGRGLVTHGFWDTDSGTGRWEYLNGRVVAPLVTGKRVLDLGINNGLMDLMMLKSGAQEVTGLEFSSEYAELARSVHQLFEWRDMQKYAFTVHNCDMRDVLARSFGEFDVVTAFCSLYYLEAEDMAAVVRKAASIVPMMILQAKTDARPEAEEKGKRSSPEYLARLLVENGFPKVETVAPKGFTRPILIGRKA